MRSLKELLALSAIVLSMSLGTPSTRADDTPAIEKPLGIGMEEWTYPFPVQFLDLNIEGQSLRTAYMDIKPPADANGKSVVLLHGKNFFGAYWDGTIQTLTARGFRVVVPDQIGFGKSSKPNIHYSFDLLAENTAKLLDELKLDRAAIVGHSMGGMLAVRFARNYPQRATHLILENPIGLEDYRLKVPPQTLGEAYKSELSKTPKQLVDYIKTYFVEWKPQYAQFGEAPARMKLSGEFPRAAMASALTYQMIYEQPVRHEFHLIQPPTLLVIGQADRTTIGRSLVAAEVLKTLGNYPELGRSATKDIPGSKLVEIENCGHIPHLEKPEQFHRALLDFLK